MDSFSLTRSVSLRRLLLLVSPCFTFLLGSCDYLSPDKMDDGEIVLCFSKSSYLVTKNQVELPDTNNFILTVTDSEGKSIYSGLYGSSPERLAASPGTYTVTAVSSEFTTPKFSSPQYGDKQVVSVASGQSCRIELICRQVNAGVKLNVAEGFLTQYPNASLHLKSAEGSLLYSYSEKRIAYFRPGNISLILSDGGKDETLFSRILESQEILTVNIAVPSNGSKSGLSISIDTSRVWNSYDYVLGGGYGESGSDRENALDVAAAKSSAGAKDVWVYGYIVGGDLTSSGVSFKAPFKSRTNIAVATRSSVSDKSSCMSVQLQKGKIRDALNLVDNPDLIGSVVFLKGDIVDAYYGIPGIQGITEFEFK